MDNLAPVSRYALGRAMLAAAAAACVLSAQPVAAFSGTWSPHLGDDIRSVQSSLLQQVRVICGRQREGNGIRTWWCNDGDECVGLTKCRPGPAKRRALQERLQESLRRIEEQNKARQEEIERTRREAEEAARRAAPQPEPTPAAKAPTAEHPATPTPATHHGAPVPPHLAPATLPPPPGTHPTSTAATVPVRVPHLAPATLPPPPAKKPAVATNSAGCNGQMTSNGCVPASTAPSRQPTSVVIGNRPDTQPSTSIVNNAGYGNSRNVPTPCQDLIGRYSCRPTGNITGASRPQKVLANPNGRQPSVGRAYPAALGQQSFDNVAGMPPGPDKDKAADELADFSKKNNMPFNDCGVPVIDGGNPLPDIPLAWTPDGILKEAIDQLGLCKDASDQGACREQYFGRAVRYAEPEIDAQCRLSGHPEEAPNDPHAAPPPIPVVTMDECAKRKFMNAFANGGVIPAFHSTDYAVCDPNSPKAKDPNVKSLKGQLAKPKDLATTAPPPPPMYPPYCEPADGYPKTCWQYNPNSTLCKKTRVGPDNQVLPAPDYSYSDNTINANVWAEPCPRPAVDKYFRDRGTPIARCMLQVGANAGKVFCYQYVAGANPGDEDNRCQRTTFATEDQFVRNQKAGDAELVDASMCQ